ncbi:hypothetical protein GKZ90_0019910 [Flavobacterium sp. MC2016-06]|jgi:hypothetical protein|uniref:hypothetical protein n=1 Tax=Flavobacterium sp. MC2016-06 TaxID=2676308 RepID=UPI0012BA5EE1|nr:hypothetical protein [Flavobacterium sp. MC2016-06]MBU3860859.1 hypothetical protein [Flavobacterium sp. MC2016-06]
MKFETVLLLCVLCFFVSCKKEIPASIKLKVEFEDKLKKELPRVYSIAVYKNGKIFKTFNRFEKPYIRKEIDLDSLSNGTYKFVYMNFLNQTVQKSVEVKENKVYNISIYPDSSDYTSLINKSFVSNLSENQQVEFYYESVGCFHSFEGSFVVTKKANAYYIKSRTISKKLNKKELDLIIKMECELDLLQDGGCTTSDYYVVKFGKNEKEFHDRTCAWQGWTNMFKQINIKS